MGFPQLPSWSLNAAILVLGFAATLTAFGGETWLKGEMPLIRRITPRGWMSLASLTLALVLGMFKEESEARAAGERKTQLDKADGELEGLGAELGRTRADLKDARDQLSQAKLELAQQGEKQTLHIVKDIQRSMNRMDDVVVTYAL
jgi:hypothetical protein